MKRFIPQMLRGRIRWVALLWATCMLAGISAHAADASADAAAAASNQLQSIDVQKLSANQLQVTLHLSGPAPEPLAFTVDKPARISLDLPNTAVALTSRRIDVGTNGVDTVIAAEANGRTRVVLNLDQQMPYQTHVSGNDVVVMIGTAVETRGAAAAKASAAAMHAATPGGRAIRSIDFRRSETGAGRLARGQPGAHGLSRAGWTLSAAAAGRGPGYGPTGSRPRTAARDWAGWPAGRPGSPPR